MRRANNYKRTSDFCQASDAGTLGPVTSEMYSYTAGATGATGATGYGVPPIGSDDPKIWGPGFWYVIHNGASKYPENAPPIWRQRMIGFINGIPVMLPCEKCQDHASAYIEANRARIDDIVSGKNSLFNFFVEFHNAVNTRHKKPLMMLEDARRLYGLK